MRHVGWICACLFIASCSVNPVLPVDGGGEGGAGGVGGQGGAATGGGGGSAGTTMDAGGQGGGHAGAGGATGGAGGSAGGAGGAGGDPCTQLETQYSATLITARMCTLGASGQCQALVSTSLPCPSCKLHVNDTSALDALAAQYQQLGCAAVPHACPAIACINPGTGACVPANSGNICE